MEIRVWLVHTGADAAIDARKSEASVDAAAVDFGAQAAMASSTAKLTSCTVDDGIVEVGFWISIAVCSTWSKSPN